MTEPKDVQLARLALKANDNNTSADLIALRDEAQKIVDTYESNIERNRKQAEERQRAIDETARRWPELGPLGCTMEESEYLFTVCGGELPTVAIDKEDGEIERYCCDEAEPIQSAVALALIDAAGRNTTAERLRKEIRSALEVLTEASVKGVLVARVEATEILVGALEASNG